LKEAEKTLRNVPCRTLLEGTWLLYFKRNAIINLIQRKFNTHVLKADNFIQAPKRLKIKQGGLVSLMVHVNQIFLLTYQQVIS
jgi:hypothetical protein